VVRQCERLGLRLLTVRNRRGFLEYVEHRGKWPSPKQRWCTSDLKRGPIHTIYTRLAAEWRAGNPEETRPCRILSVMGLRAEESPSRAKKSPLKVNESASNGRREVTDYLPIHRLTEAEVWTMIRQSVLSDLIHPAYEFVGRLSCSFCIFSPLSALVAAARRRPELAERYAAVEKSTGHLFRRELSMSRVIEIAKSDAEFERPQTWRM
jgi:3'-phosphoadenosine 5'-phosphosulfate sulfotransferase (PAPS reductase)/FAD synthetase